MAQILLAMSPLVIGGLVVCALYEKIKNEETRYSFSMNWNTKTVVYQVLMLVYAALFLAASNYGW